MFLFLVSLRPLYVVDNSAHTPPSLILCRGSHALLRIREPSFRPDGARTTRQTPEPVAIKFSRSQGTFAESTEGSGVGCV